MNQFKKLAIAGAIGLMGVAAQASTLVFDFGGRVNDLQIPAAYADLYDTWTSNADFDDFYGTVILENFENYATGTHTISIASSASPLKLSLVSGILTGIEGTRSRQTGSFIPDDSQLGSSGALTIVDGVVTGFTWSAVGADSAALSSFNERTFEGGNFPVRLTEITVNVGAPVMTAFAGGVFAQRMNGTSTVILSAVPEPGTYALMFAGLAAVGFLARRRAGNNAA